VQTKQTQPGFKDYVEALRAEHPELARDFAGFDGLEDVLQWLGRRDLGRGAVDIVGQDEFHYDFLVRLEGGRWLAVGVT
jgi:hypothetical protein